MKEHFRLKQEVKELNFLFSPEDHTAARTTSLTLIS